MGKILAEAVRKTLIHRDRELNKDAFGEISIFKDNIFLLKQWRAFEPAGKISLSFEEAIQRLVDFLEPIYQSILENEPYTKNWNCEHHAWEDVK